MTRFITFGLGAAAAAFIGTASLMPASAQEAIMLETIGAVRMLPPREAQAAEVRRLAGRSAQTLAVARTTRSTQ